MAVYCTEYPQSNPLCAAARPSANAGFAARDSTTRGQKGAMHAVPGHLTMTEPTEGLGLPCGAWSNPLNMLANSHAPTTHVCKKNPPPPHPLPSTWPAVLPLEAPSPRTASADSYTKLPIVPVHPREGTYKALLTHGESRLLLCSASYALPVYYPSFRLSPTYLPLR